ncbi:MULTISPECIES: DUF4363 domain-containing protein [unclassified Nostoc]|uniref:DUF4363 domain-containing protein n=1 Tax=unclassified Nostoc TaxID=2593658 RepID=UPI000B95B518|nr:MULTISPECIES: DUF4363 domain-containing protein [unclassified Nostoc]AVH64994.1 hypothetical protein NPM_3388 [Nostoc sp. 'Peltigera membranacea cyanobiont' N6]OYE05786.1 DUF4363 domain-containing protein [Nostoc sp. 'Peltigera membranacea cyanobiont' 232]
MKRLIYIIPVAAIGLLTLVGCNSDQKSTTQTPATTETTAATTVSKTPVATQGGFDTLVGVVSNTKTAVQAGKFDTAQQEFNKFENAWSKVEDGVKTKSSKTYNVIEDTATQVKGSLKAKDKAKSLKGLQTLNTNIATVSK